MHLPRGTSHSIKKNISLNLLLNDVIQSRFSGTVFIISQGGGATLVMKEGVAILAEHVSSTGTQALNELQKVGDLMVDAELSLFNDIQIGLAMEFNRACTVQSIPGNAVLFVRKEQTPPVVDTRGGGQERSARSHQGQVGRTAPSSPSLSEVDTPNPSLLGDLDALDQIDLVKMAGKIRMNAKNIAKNLKLDHLIGDEFEKRVGK